MMVKKPTHMKGASAAAMLGMAIGLGLSALKTALSTGESLMCVTYSKEEYQRRRKILMEQTNVIALPPPTTSEVLARITEKKPINTTGLVNPKLIELQALNVVEISLGKSSYAIPYAMLHYLDDTDLSLYNLISGVILRTFPNGTTIWELNRALRHGYITCWYSTVEDFVNKRNRVSFNFGGVESVSP
jgi:hypothetical protein